MDENGLFNSSSESMRTPRGLLPRRFSYDCQPFYLHHFLPTLYLNDIICDIRFRVPMAVEPRLYWYAFSSELGEVVMWWKVFSR